MASARQHFDENDKSVYAHVVLDCVPVTALPYHAVRGFLGTIASSSHGGKTEYENAMSVIDHDLAETMWGVLSDYTLTEPTSGGELAVRLSGTPDHYYHIEANERAERIRARGEIVRRSA